MRGRALGVIAAAAVFAADQASKYWMLEVFGIEGRAAIPLLPFLDVVMVWNRGISYGLFQINPLVLLTFSVVVSLALGVWMWRAGTLLTTLALGLVIGGALGNALDRYRFGAVADFFHFHTPFWLGPLSNYVFNVADMGIVAGAGLLLYEAFFVKADGPRAESA
jgi:signal peptidase II